MKNLHLCFLSFLGIMLLCYSAKSQPVALDDEASVDSKIEQAASQETTDRKQLTQTDLPPEQHQAIQERIQERAKLVDDSLTRCPNCAKAYTAAANFSYQAEDYKQGIDRATRSISLAQSKNDPKTQSKALATRAQGYVKLGKSSEAYRDAIKALELDGYNRQAFSIAMLTKSLANSGDNSEAKPTSTKATQEASPQKSQPRNNILLSSPSKLKAQTLLKEANNKILLGDPKAALLSLDQALALDPEDAKIYLARAKAKLAFKDGPGAKQDVNSALNLAPDLAEGYWLRGQARELSGETSDSILQDFKTAAGLDAGRFDAAYKEALGRLGPNGTLSFPAHGEDRATQAKVAQSSDSSLYGWLLASSEKIRLPPWLLILLAFVSGYAVYRLARALAASRLMEKKQKRKNTP